MTKKLYYEHLSTCPMRKTVLVVMPFNLQSWLTLTPFLLAIFDNVSPFFTL